ncbi:MAG: hypothetical protein Q9170_000740 [Blastenia crenularia]
MAGMTPSEILYQTEHIQDDRSPDVIGASVTMAILATAAVTLRFVCRKQMKVAISYDDYFMLVALVGTQVNPAIWSTIEPCVGIVSACLPIIGPALRSKLGPLTGTSWLSRSKRSVQSSSYVTNPLDRRNVPGSLQKKPTVTATVYSRDTLSDEEMAVPLRDVVSRG